MFKTLLNFLRSDTPPAEAPKPTGPRSRFGKDMPLEHNELPQKPASPLGDGQYWLYLDQSQRRAMVVVSSLTDEGARLEQEHLQEIPSRNVVCIEVVSRVPSAEYWQQPSLPALCQIIRRLGIAIEDEASLPVSAQLVGRDVSNGLWLHVKVGGNTKG